MSFRERPLGRAKNLLHGQLAGQNQKRWPYRSEKAMPQWFSRDSSPPLGMTEQIKPMPGESLCRAQAPKAVKRAKRPLSFRAEGSLVPK